ncbi:3-beta-hydroxysteroid-Delta(8),Delta(7)-isomerase [Lamellibrachia satsuma]|nr:3-beta-hydroxysteroid-Delta(8),Delta(7)-isomerase [Lamellibrachia satsuma]
MLTLWLYSGSLPYLKGRFITRMKICWFLMCGLIHCVVEGYFSIYHRTLAGHQTFFGQMWKEYAKGDSRYLTSDTFTVCMESITCYIDGPLAFLAVYAFLYKRPYRHIVQITLSLCQVYGAVLYFLTELKDDFVHGEMWHPLYFWFYFVFMNSLWIVIPLGCIFESCLCLNAAQQYKDAKSLPGKRKKTK